MNKVLLVKNTNWKIGKGKWKLTKIPLHGIFPHRISLVQKSIFRREGEDGG